MAAQCEEVRIVLQPLFVAESVVNCFLKEIKSVVSLSDEVVGAGHVVEDGGFFRVDGQGAICPLKSAFAVADAQRCAGTEVECARIVGMNFDVALYNTKGDLADIARLLHAPEAAEAVFQLHESLIVSGIEFAGGPEEVGRLLHAALRETRAA